MPYAADLYYYAYHPEDRQRLPVVLIHGAGGDHLHWPVEIRRLPDYRVYAVDLPGHGKSGGHGLQRVEDHSGRVMEWMDEFELSRAVLVGHSMGGAIALTSALRHPDRVLGLGLVGSGARLPVNPDLVENTAHESTFPGAVKMIIKWAFYPETEKSIIQAAEKAMRKTRPTVLHGDFQACDAYTVEEHLPGIRTPVQVLCGREDKMTPLRLSQYLADHIPGAELAVIPEAGHMVMLEKAGAVKEILEAFLVEIKY